MAQLVDLLLLTTEICGSLPVICKFIVYQLKKLCIKLTKMNEKDAENDPLKNSSRGHFE